jgi:hypothetical protein
VLFHVSLNWDKAADTGEAKPSRDRSTGMSPIQYFYPPDNKTVGLRGELLDQAKRSLGRLEVVVSYNYLMKEILSEG